jgi:hypothetical protein
MIFKLALSEEFANALVKRAPRMKYSVKWNNLSIFGMSILGISSPGIEEE